jgi:hypothetical protein
MPSNNCERPNDSPASLSAVPLADDLDRPLWGAEAIGRAANLLDEDGNVDLRRTYFKLEKGYLPADKCGREWVTTPRRLRKRFSGE